MEGVDRRTVVEGVEVDETEGGVGFEETQVTGGELGYRGEPAGGGGGLEKGAKGDLLLPIEMNWSPPAFPRYSRPSHLLCPLSPCSCGPMLGIERSTVESSSSGVWYISMQDSQNVFIAPQAS